MLSIFARVEVIVSVLNLDSQSILAELWLLVPTAASVDVTIVDSIGKLENSAESVAGILNSLVYFI